LFCTDGFYCRDDVACLTDGNNRCTAAADSMRGVSLIFISALGANNLHQLRPHEPLSGSVQQMLITKDVREKAALVLVGIRCRAMTSATEPGNREVSQRQSKSFQVGCFFKNAFTGGSGLVR
jgi:hypothetical protein